MPFAWWIARLCEEFHCVPSVAYREYLQAPDGWLERVLEARSYAAAHAVFEAAENKADLPKTPMMRTVTEIEMTLAAEAFRRG